MSKKIDGQATAELAGALLRGFLFGDEFAVPNNTPPAPQPTPPAPQPTPPAPQPTPPAPQVTHQSGRPLGVHIVATTYQVIDRLKPGLFEVPPRLDLIQQAFDCFNAVGLSYTDATLIIATIRANMVRYDGITSEAVDYAQDVALETVDQMALQTPETD